MTANQLNISKTMVPTIKIDDDSNEEYEMINGKKDMIDISTQTDQSDLVVALKLLVKNRLKQYQDAFVKEEMFSRKINPSLLRLKQENNEIKKELNQLRDKVKQLEKKALKRVCDEVLLSYEAKKKTFNTTTYKTSLWSSKNLHAPTDTLQFTHTPDGTSQLIRSPVSVISPRSEIAQQRYKAPVQTVTPVQRMQNGQQRSFQEQRVLINDGTNEIRYLQGVNTQVVASDPGLRMTSLTPRVHNGQPHMIGNGHLNGKYQQMSALQQQQPLFKQQQQQQNVGQVSHHRYRQIRPLIPSSSTTIMQESNTILPKLKASISASGNGIVLTWDCEKNATGVRDYRMVKCYHLFAHQAKDNDTSPPTDMKQWKTIGIVNALPLPMACTLTQFAAGNIYFFAVVPVDTNGREGELSNPCIIQLNPNS